MIDYNNDDYIYNILENHPAFPDKRSRRHIRYHDFQWLLGNVNFVRNFVRHCNMSKLRPVDLAIMVQKQPDLIDLYGIDYDWDSLSGMDWCNLITHDPKYATLCNWRKFDGYAWVHLLKERPEFSNKCKWGSLDGTLWQILLSVRPEFAKHCKWERLDDYDWCFLLCEQPEIINDNEEAQILAVQKSSEVIVKIDKPCRTAIDLHEMLWVL